MVLYLRTRIRIEGVIPDAIARANEAELFTLIEFIHDHVAKPRPGSGRFQRLEQLRPAPRRAA
jgi:hypothetical protein